MQKYKILIATLLVLSAIFLGLQSFKYEFEAAGIRALLLTLLTILYCARVKKKRFFFFLFLITFCVAELLNFFSWFYEIYEDSIDYMYYISNGLYILSYSFLITLVLKSMNIKEVILKFPFHLLILFVLDIFCVSIVTGTTKSQLSIYEYSLEFIYNTVIMVLLSVAFINYIYRDDKKSMNLLVGSIFIVFSEVIQLAYFYISDTNFLNVICSLFLVLAFLFFYLQSRLSHEDQFNRIGQDLSI